MNKTATAATRGVKKTTIKDLNPKSGGVKGGAIRKSLSK